MAEETKGSGMKMVGALAAIALVLSAVSLAGSFRSSAPAPPPAADRTVYMSAVEWKGGTSVTSEPYPGNGTAPAGGGYLLKYPDSTGRWETSTYRWEPGIVVVNQGDRVTLKIWGVNGKEHPSTIEGYASAFTVKRGQLTDVSLTVDKAGTFQITCSAHPPSMTAYLVVLPR